MSVTTDLFCLDCRIRLDVGQDTVIHFAEEGFKPNLNEFLQTHKGHRLRFDDDSWEPQYADDYINHGEKRDMNDVDTAKQFAEAVTAADTGMFDLAARVFAITPADVLARIDNPQAKAGLELAFDGLKVQYLPCFYRAPNTFEVEHIQINPETQMLLVILCPGKMILRLPVGKADASDSSEKAANKVVVTP